jgi:Ca-activated chloride channel family protein
MVTLFQEMAPASAAFLIAIPFAVAIIIAEWLHQRRVKRVAFLAFGEDGRPRRWVFAVPTIRTISATVIVWGMAALFFLEPSAVEKEPTSEASKHLLVCLDASPSMFVQDSGPDGKTKRAIWAGEVIQAILDRLDTETTRVTVFAVYTKSIPVIEDTFDMNVVRNLLDGLPLYAAFESGSTKLSTGINDALTYAKQWKPDSSTLLIVSDGDSDERPQIRSIPSSIADTIIVGVGDPVRPTMISGHRSTQDVASLKSLALKMKGVYHQGNNKHLPSNILNKLTMIRPRIGEGMGLREWAVLCIGIGGSVLAMIGPALLMFGKRASAHPVVQSKKATAVSVNRLGARSIAGVVLANPIVEKGTS